MSDAEDYQDIEDMDDIEALQELVVQNTVAIEAVIRVLKAKGMLTDDELKKELDALEEHTLDIMKSFEAK